MTERGTAPPLRELSSKMTERGTAPPLGGGELSSKMTERGSKFKGVIFMYLPYDSKNLSHARQLRRNMTKEERHLWYDFLRGYPVKIMKQKPIGNYIVDFFCESAKLVIELDGSQHFEENGMAYDEQRTRFLEGLGLTVVRYSNADINRHFREVCENLDRLIQSKREGYNR